MNLVFRQISLIQSQELDARLIATWWIGDKEQDMPQRKGQFIVNYIQFKALPKKYPEIVHMNDGVLTYDCSSAEYDEMIYHYLFDMRDEEFAKVELAYHKYIIPYIHGVKNRKEEIEQLVEQTRYAMDMMEADRKCELCHAAIKYGEDHVSIRSRNEMWHLKCYQKAEKSR